MAKAADIMTPNPHMIGSGIDIMEAAEFYAKHGITTAPVQNPLGEILGLLSEIDLVKAVVQFKAQQPKPQLTKVVHAQSWFEEPIFVQVEDPISEVVKALIRSHTHRVLVKNKKDQVVGVISPKDLLRSLVGDQKEGSSLLDELNKLHREIHDMKGKMLEMSMYLETYDTVFQSGFYMVHSADKEGKILMANDRLHNWLGYNSGELIGKLIFDLYDPSVHSEAREGLKKVMTSGRHYLTNSIMNKKNGEKIKVDLASSAMRDSNGRFLGTFTISRALDGDVSSRAPDEILNRKN